jgi:hypothetical protein
VDTLKAEMIALEKELLEERTKVKALSEELENPMNVHRWRKLEGCAAPRTLPPVPRPAAAPPASCAAHQRPFVFASAARTRLPTR